MARFIHDEECSSSLTGTDNGGNCDNLIGASSRPHSSTSAELENSISALTIQPQIVQPSVPIRTKETRCVLVEICTRKIVYRADRIIFNISFTFLFYSLSLSIDIRVKAISINS